LRATQLDVAVDDTFFVHGGEALRHPHGVTHGFTRRSLPCSSSTRRLPPSKSSETGGRAVLFADIVNAENIVARNDPRPKQRAVQQTSVRYQTRFETSMLMASFGSVTVAT
jgi:hypothetical protein